MVEVDMHVDKYQAAEKLTGASTCAEVWHTGASLPHVFFLCLGASNLSINDRLATGLSLARSGFPQLPCAGEAHISRSAVLHRPAALFVTAPLHLYSLHPAASAKS